MPDLTADRQNAFLDLQLGSDQRNPVICGYNDWGGHGTAQPLAIKEPRASAQIHPSGRVTNIYNGLQRCSPFFVG